METVAEIKVRHERERDSMEDRHSREYDSVHDGSGTSEEMPRDLSARQSAEWTRMERRQWSELAAIERPKTIEAGGMIFQPALTGDGWDATVKRENGFPENRSLEFGYQGKPKGSIAHWLTPFAQDERPRIFMVNIFGDTLLDVAEAVAAVTFEELELCGHRWTVASSGAAVAYDADGCELSVKPTQSDNWLWARELPPAATKALQAISPLNDLTSGAVAGSRDDAMAAAAASKEILRLHVVTLALGLGIGIWS
ncbi:MAG TPA: hypothetical protein VGU69_10595 [Rhizomicrobium sp.]|nr:hypothetical protein [Rhizomicrobium sp.]